VFVGFCRCSLCLRGFAAVIWALGRLRGRLRALWDVNVVKIVMNWGLEGVFWRLVFKSIRFILGFIYILRLSERLSGAKRYAD